MLVVLRTNLAFVFTLILGFYILVLFNACTTVDVAFQNDMQLYTPSEESQRSTDSVDANFIINRDGGNMNCNTSNLLNSGNLSCNTRLQVK